MKSPRQPDVLSRLRDLIHASGLSVAELARRIGQPRQQLHDSLTRAPRIDTVARILHALGRTWADLDVGAAPTGPWAILLQLRPSDLPLFVGTNLPTPDLAGARLFPTRAAAENYLRKTPPLQEVPTQIVPVSPK